MMENRAQKRKRQVEKKLRKEMKMKHMTKEDHRLLKKNIMVVKQKEEPGVSEIGELG